MNTLHEYTYHRILKICEVKLYLFETLAVGDLKMAGKKVLPFLSILTEDLPSAILVDHSLVAISDGCLPNFFGLRPI